jgi:hypothetical protein
MMEEKEILQPILLLERRMALTRMLIVESNDNRNSLNTCIVLLY